MGGGGGGRRGGAPSGGGRRPGPRHCEWGAMSEPRRQRRRGSHWERSWEGRTCGDDPRVRRPVRGAWTSHPFEAGGVVMTVDGRIGGRGGGGGGRAGGAP